ncbi:MAG: OmpA family protein [Pseudomonadota bacterium]
MHLILWPLLAGGAQAGVDESWREQFPDAEVSLAELGDGFVRVGRPVSKESLDNLEPGDSQERVIELLGPPDMAARNPGGWYLNYNFNLPFTNGDDVLVCQYQVSLDRRTQVKSTGWRRYLCEHLFKGLQGEPPRFGAEVIRLSTDVLFDFREHRLTPAGRGRIEELARKLNNEYQDPLITIVGHADRIGAAGFNLELSRKRAEAVRTALTSHDINRKAMVAEGRGQSEPLVFCRGQEITEELKACLRPNRRVDVEVVERGDVRITEDEQTKTD